MWIRSPATCARSGATAADAPAPGRSRLPWKGGASPRPGGASAASCANGGVWSRTRADDSNRTGRGSTRRSSRTCWTASSTVTPRTRVPRAILPMSASADRLLKKELVYRNHHTTIGQPRRGPDDCVGGPTTGDSTPPSDTGVRRNSPNRDSSSKDLSNTPLPIQGV